MALAVSLMTGLAYAGAGTGVGSIGAAWISSRSGKGEARAHAADMLTEGYGGLADRLQKDNARLERDNTRLRKAILDLIEAEDAHQHACPDHHPIDDAVAIARDAVIETSI